MNKPKHATTKPTTTTTPNPQKDTDMTLLLFPDVEQGTDEWHDLRRGIVTASTVGKLVTSKTLKVASNDDSRGLTMLLVSERITGWTEDTYTNFDMMRGTLDEPIARDLYSKTHAPVVEMGFMIRQTGGISLGYSPDGLVADDGLIEIKSRRPKAQLATILADQIPAENMAQLQCGLLVSERAWCDYVSFCGGMPLYVKRILPDPRWFDAITNAVLEFEAVAAEMEATYRARTADLPMTERTLNPFDDEITVN